MARRVGWLVLAVVSGVFLVGTVLGGAWAAGQEIRDGRYGAVITSVGMTGIVVLFWKWIGLGAWERAQPPDPNGTGPAVSEQIGPWGWVGRGLLGVLITSFLGLGIWTAIETNQANQATERIREDADRAARKAELTVDDVAAAKAEWNLWTTNGGTGPDPLAELLTVPGARVVDAESNEERASILLRTDDSPPCVVVDIDQHALATTRVTSNC